MEGEREERMREGEREGVMKREGEGVLESSQSHEGAGFSAAQRERCV